MEDLLQFLRDRLGDDEYAAQRAAALCGCHPAAASWEFRDGDDKEDGRIHIVGDPHPIQMRKRRRLARRWNRTYADLFIAEHIVRHAPARVLAEVASKMRLVDASAADCPAACAQQGTHSFDGSCALRWRGPAQEEDGTQWLPVWETRAGIPMIVADRRELAPPVTTEYTLRLLALPYAEHPDYRPEWTLSKG
ncbi:DUF6221 family protein [Streptomyces sp. NPDC058612]|uniref:DUF6221 family protein n=1 Tax=Streptomyces sp. NPDC058612 TaxID=3346555 RepID=UPI0036584350